MSVGTVSRVQKLVLKILMTELPHLGYNQINYRERLQNGLTNQDFRGLQRSMIARWEREIVEDGVDDFWNRHQVSFHCVMVGHNLEIGMLRRRWI